MKGRNGREGRKGGKELVALLALVALASGAAAQSEVRPRVRSTAEFVAGEPRVGRIVEGAPYSGEATTTVSQTLADGTRIERTTVTKVFRDSRGRERREQTVLGLGALGTSSDAAPLVTIIDPVAGVSYVLQPNSRKAMKTAFQRVEASRVEARRRAERLAGASGQAPPPPPPPPVTGSVSIAGQPPPPPIGPAEQSLGSRQIEGLTAVGTRRTETIPAGRIGNDRPIEVTDERWDSPDLKVLLQSRHDDPRTGIVEYRLTGISRAEPSHDLFVVPADYTVVEARNDR